MLLGPSDIPNTNASAAVAPAEHQLFEVVHDHYGARLALVFGNEAREGLCPYYRAGRCFHCDVGAGEGSAFDGEANAARLAFFEARYAASWPGLVHLVLYNSGSTLNAQELSSASLERILAFAARLPEVREVSLDSREPYIVARTLDTLARDLRPDQRARPIIGLETADDHRRETLLSKRMPRSAVERAFAAVGEANARHGQGRFGVDVNIVIAGPGTEAGSDVSAAEDAAATARYVYELGARHGVAVDLNAHPYYLSSRSRERFSAHPRCSLSAAVAGVRALVAERDAAPLACRGGIYVGWEDEGFDTERESRADLLSRAGEAFERFNQTLDPSTLDGLRALT